MDERAELSAVNGLLGYRVIVDGNQVLARSMLEIETDDRDLGQDVTLGLATSRKVDEHYRFLRAHAEAISRAHEVTVRAQSHGESHIQPRALHPSRLIGTTKLHHQVQVGGILCRLEEPVRQGAAGG